MWALEKRRVRRWLSYTFIYRPQVAYAYHWKYRHKPLIVRVIQSTYWPHVRNMRSYHNPLLALIPKEDELDREYTTPIVLRRRD
jgi:hypothetical protein